MSIAPTIIQFSKEAKDEYLQELSRHMNALCQDLYESKLISPIMTSYLDTLSGIIGVYSHNFLAGNISGLTVSNVSGMPMYSTLLAVSGDQSRKNNNKLYFRDEKDIVNSLIEAIYTPNEQLLNGFRKEFQRAYYYNKLERIGKFEDIISINHDQSSNIELDRYTVEHASYPLSEMSVVTLSAQLSRPKPFIGYNKKKISPNVIQNIVGWDIEDIYHFFVNDKTYPGNITKTKTQFHFNGKSIDENDTPYIVNTLKEHSGYILEFRLDTIENLDVTLAQGIASLKNADKADIKHSASYLFICRQSMVSTLNDNLKRRGQIYKIIPVE